MKSNSIKYAHQYSRSPNLDIHNPSKIGKNIAAQTRGPTSSCCLTLTARIRHSYQELLQICVAEVKRLCEVRVKCLASHSIRNYRLN
jgi:hypothetical protein